MAHVILSSAAFRGFRFTVGLISPEQAADTASEE